MPNERRYFIEPTKDGRYGVRGAGSIRATFVFSTHQEAISYAAKLNPNDHANTEEAPDMATGGATGGDRGDKAVR
jgi:hypothetical protein